MKTIGPRSSQESAHWVRRVWAEATHSRAVVKQAIKDGKTYPLFSRRSSRHSTLSFRDSCSSITLWHSRFRLDLGRGDAGNARYMVFDRIPRLKLFEWCDRLPQSRYPAVAARIIAFQSSGSPAKLEWTQMARDLIVRAPDATAVLRALIGQFSPQAGWGSIASAIEPHIELLKEFTEHSNPTLASFAVSEMDRLRKAVVEVRQSERKIDLVEEETFE